MVVGDYQKGELAGPGKIVYNNDDFLLVNFCRGAIHGLARRFSHTGEILWVGRFYFGKPSGTCWQFLPYGGYITGYITG